MNKLRINVLYLILQSLVLVSTIYFLVAYCLELNTPLVSSNRSGLINSVYTLLWSFLPYFSKPLRVKFTKTLEVYFILAMIGHFMIGSAFNGYHTKFYSFVLHFINCFLMGVVIYGLILRVSKKQGRLFMFIMTTACVACIGVIWELYEFFMDIFMDRNMQRTLENVTREPFLGKRAILDTMIDFCMDMIGGLIAGIVSAIKIKEKPLYAYFELKSERTSAGLGEVVYYDEEKKNKR